ESGDHLVQNHQSAVPVTETADIDEKVGARGGCCLSFQHYTGNPIGVLLEQRLERSSVVEPEFDGEMFYVGRNSGRHRCAADKPVIGGEEGLIAADCHQVAPRVCACQL